MSIKQVVVGGVISLVVGGTAYTVNQADVVKNFSNDTGLTQEQAEKYVNGIKEEDMVTYDKLGESYVKEGQDIINEADSIDCVKYQYDWETVSLPCAEGNAQLHKTGQDEVILGESYKKLNSDSASKSDMSSTIQYIDNVNTDYNSGIMTSYLDKAAIDDIKNTNSYNKALLKSALEGN